MESCDVMMTSSNNIGDSPIVFLTAGRTALGFNAAQEVAHVTGNACGSRENQLDLEGSFEFIARRFLYRAQLFRVNDS